MSERPPPSPAEVALALAAIGRVDAAHVLLEIALDEDPGDEECEEVLERLSRLEHEPLQPEETPRVFLGPQLVDAYVQAGLLREAQLIAQTLWSIAPDETGARRVRLFEQVLGALPADAPEGAARAHALIAEGAVASALLAYRDAAARPDAPGWVRERAEALHVLVLARAAASAPPRVVSQTDDTTRVGRDPRRIVALLLERNLAGAAEEARFAAASRGGELAELADALARLVEAAERVPRDAPESRSTLPMGRRGVADLHVRMASFEQAAVLYRAAVEADPNDDQARAMLEALRVVSRHLRTVSVEQVDSVSVPTPDDATRRPTDLPETRVHVPLPPSSERDPDLRVVAAAASAQPPLDQTGELVIDVVHDLGDGDGAPPQSESAAVVAQTLHKSGQRAPQGSWAVASGSLSLRGSRDDDTAITSPEVAAELALRQGYPERALAVYRELARARPGEPRFARRVADIERTLGLALEPKTAPASAPRDADTDTETRPVLFAGRPVRSPTGPYRPLARGGPADAGGPGPTVSPRSRRAARDAPQDEVALPSLPDIVPAVIATSEVARSRSPFDDIDEEATAVNIGASLRGGDMLIGPARAPIASTDPLPPVSTRVEDLPPPTVRLPGVSEALARQMPKHPEPAFATPSPEPVAHAPAASEPAPTPIGLGSPDDSAQPTVRLEAAEVAALQRSAEVEPSAPREQERPAVAARRIIPIGE